jgi:hypothetical protein
MLKPLKNNRGCSMTFQTLKGHRNMSRPAPVAHVLSDVLRELASEKAHHDHKGKKFTNPWPSFQNHGLTDFVGALKDWWVTSGHFGLHFLFICSGALAGIVQEVNQCHYHYLKRMFHGCWRRLRSHNCHGWVMHAFCCKFLE